MKKSSSPKNKSIEAEKQIVSDTNFPIVAIGASAGGLEAVTELLRNLSPNTGMAFLYVQHLSPDHKSMLSTILAKTTSMKVHEAANKEKILPNNLYLIPPDKEMTIVDGSIKLTPRPATPKLNLPIDILFSSLAATHKEKVIGIILSGSATDGTRGIKAIKHEGGLTFAQDNTAKFGSMPMSAISAGAIDFVLSPKEIAREITRLSKHPFIKSNRNKKEEEVIINSDPDLKDILSLLHKVHGVDFSQYKMNTIKRRIMRRMLLYKIKSLKEYSKLLLEKPEEPDILYQDLLINVTAFFRDTESHQYLKTTLLPKLLKSKKQNESLRIWVAACATGEEAYSIAITLLEIQSSKFTNIPVQIFATDLSAKSISKARIGEYSKLELENVSPKRIQRFYIKSQNGFRVSKQVRDMCVFAQHNVLSDPPFAHVDFVSCCNLLIYLDTAAQKKVIATFHYALNDNRFLMLGKSESIGASTKFFSTVNRQLKIFLRKNNSGVATLPVLTPRFTRHAQLEAQPVTKGGKTLRNTSVNSNDLDKAIDALMLSRYMPPSVIINHQLEILQFRGATDLFISPSTGRATFNILKMTRPEVAFELRSSISKAIKSKQIVHKKGIEIKLNNVVRTISIEVVPLKIEWDEPVLLILFSEQQQTDMGTSLSLSKGNRGPTAAKDRRIKKLEEQIEIARNDMVSFTQDQEAFNEELQSANEEVVSSNEELQTINEELETSREEIESTNEELSTTNQELQGRNEQLNEAYHYTETLLLTIPVPLLILDSMARVKSANQSFYRNYNVTEEETEGHRLYDLGNGQWNIPKLRNLLEDIIPHNTIFENYEVEHEFESIGKKIMVLNARRIQLTGQELILLAITDITEVRKLALEKSLKEKEVLELQIEAQKKEEEAYKTANARVHNLFMEAPAIICVHRGPEHVYELSNKIHQQVLGNRDIIGKPVRKAMPDLEGSGIYELLDHVYSTGEPFVGNEYPVKIDRGNGKLEEAYFNFVYQATHDGEGEIDGLLVHGVEVTEQVLSKKQIESNKIQLQNIFLNAPAAIAVFEGSEHKYILANKAYEKLSTRNAADLLGKNMQDLFPELKGTGTLELFDKVLETGESFSTPEYALMLDLKNEGALRQYYFNFSIEPLRNNSGEIYAVMAITYDITDQVEAGKKIKETEKQEAFLLKLSDALKELIDPVEIQLTACRILGEHVKVNRVLYGEVINEEQIILNNNYVNGVSPIIATLDAEQFGRNVIDAFKRNEKIIISDINTDPGYTEEEKQSFLSLDVVANAGMGLVKGGRWVATFGMHYNAPRIWTASEIWLLEETAERTWAAVERAKAEEALRINEERLRNLKNQLDLSISAGKIGIWSLNVKTNQLHWSKEQCNLYGITEQEFEQTPEAFWKFVDPVDLKRLQKESKVNFKSQLRDFTHQFRITRKDGTERWIESRTRTEYDEDGNPQFITGINIDITDEKLFSQDLERKVQMRTAEIAKKNEDLEKMNEELEAFTYISSHDLQEPLRKIQTFAVRLLEKEKQNLSDTGKNYFQRMQESAKRMQTLIQDLLAFSRLTTAERKFESTDLNTIIEEVKNEFIEDIAQKRAIIEVNEICDLKIIPFQFRQLMQNLISNALKFSNPGIPPHIKIECRNIEYSKINIPNLPPHSEYSHITCTDNGIGFEQHFSNQIFQVFQKLHSQDEYSGTGIGLAIVKKIVDNHNGIITATSKLGKGARFDIYIPA